MPSSSRRANPSSPRRAATPVDLIWMDPCTREFILVEEIGSSDEDYERNRARAQGSYGRPRQSADERTTRFVVARLLDDDEARQPPVREISLPPEEQEGLYTPENWLYRNLRWDDEPSREVELPAGENIPAGEQLPAAAGEVPSSHRSPVSPAAGPSTPAAAAGTPPNSPVLGESSNAAQAVAGVEEAPASSAGELEHEGGTICDLWGQVCRRLTRWVYGPRGAGPEERGGEAAGGPRRRQGPRGGVQKRGRE